ncbi:MAG: hypothetical protein ACLFUG_08170 [Nitriliruptoraceae bacterium]
MPSIRSWTLGFAAATVLLAGCGDEADDAVASLTDAIDDAAEPEPDTAADDPATDAAADAGTAPQAEGATVTGRAIDATVFHAGLEYTVSELVVVDLDEGADERVRGLELTFDVSVFNTGTDTVQPAPPVSLRWDVPGTDEVVDVPGAAEVRQVPGESSSSGEIVIPLLPDDLADYDDATARLIIGRSGQSAAEVPVGAGAELITRLPVPQPLEGTTLEVGDLVMTITAAEVRWDNLGTPTHVEDGLARFEVTYSMENLGEAQSCSRRGEGNSWFLTLPNGDAVADFGVSERCVRRGETITDVFTGFVIDADYAGDYTLRHVREGDIEGEAAITLVEAPATP